jgi:hypothetical protein
MNIALDSNIFIADPWFRSQSMRAFLDFLERTRSTCLLSEVVGAEVRGNARRRFSDAVQEIDTAIKKAQQNGVVDLPAFSRDSSFSATYSHWASSFEKVLDKHSVGVTASRIAVSEAIRRAAERLAPCNEKGEGVRDAIIWLSLLDYCSKKRKMRELVFISSNTKDFASQDRNSLRDDLKTDIEARCLKVRYFTSLDEFLKQYAEPMKHITPEWISEHFQLERASLLISRALTPRSVVGHLSIDDPDSAERFIIVKALRVIGFKLGPPFDHYLWRFNDDHVEARLSVPVKVEAEVECIRNSQPALFYHTIESANDLEVDHRLLSASGELRVDISAEITKGGTKLLAVESISSRR